MVLTVLIQGGRIIGLLLLICAVILIADLKGCNL